MRVNPTKLVLGVLAAPITALSAWLTASVAKYGVHLDASGVNAALIAGATCGITVMVKLIHDVETTIEHDPKAKQDIDDADVIGCLLRAGDIVMSGALAKMLPAEPGSIFTAEFGALGRVSVSFAP